MSHLPDLGAFIRIQGCVSCVLGELGSDAALEHLFVALLEPCRHMLQFFFLGAESEQSLRYALLQRDRMDSLFEFSEQPLNPPKSPSREVPELGLSRGRLSLWPVEGLELRVGAAVRQVALGSRRGSAGNRRLTRRLSSRPSHGQGRCRWRR